MKTNLTSNETVCGWIYLFLQLFLLPSLFQAVNSLLPQKLSSAELNFAYFFLNFLVILWIFHDFLGNSFKQVTQHPIVVMEAVILGAVFYFAGSYAVEWIIGKLAPGFANANDASVMALYRSSPFLMTLGTVILVPPVEECLYRGVIFRRLYGVNKWAAYILSIAIFTLVHILGFLGTYSPLEVCMAWLQYLPAGLILAWAYTKGGTIYAPIVIHALANASAIYRMR